MTAVTLPPQRFVFAPIPPPADLPSSHTLPPSLRSPQEEAISALEKFPTPASRMALTDILETEQCFYRVRMQACFCLAKVSTAKGMPPSLQLQGSPTLFGGHWDSIYTADIVSWNP